MVNKLDAHHQVIVKELARLFTVGTDPAHFGCQVDDHIGLGIINHAQDVGFFYQVIFRVSRHENIVRTVFF